MLTNGVKAIHTDFLAAVEKFQGVQYDVMDTDARQFDEDFYAFRVVIRELERRLAAIIIQAFDDCTTISMTFKLLDSFEGLLDREVIAADLEKKHADLLHSYASDLKDVSDIFHLYKDRPVVAKNSAPHSGAVAWVRGLVERIDEPMQKLRTMNKVRAGGLCDCICSAVHAACAQQCGAWTPGAPNQCCYWLCTCVITEVVLCAATWQASTIGIPFKDAVSLTCPAHNDHPHMCDPIKAFCFYSLLAPCR